MTATKLRVWRARKRIETAAAADPVLREFLRADGAHEGAREADRQIPVEPLDEERLTNIERSLVVRVSEMRLADRCAAPRRVLGFAGAVAFAVGAALARLEASATGPRRSAPRGRADDRDRGDGERQASKLGDATIASAPDTRVASRTPGATRP